MVKTIAVFVALISMQVASAGMINSAAPQPTLEQNFSAARTVFRGRVKTQTRYQTPQGTNAYKIQLDVSEAWKGSPPASITVYHPTVNMFEPFGQTATPGSD